MKKSFTSTLFLSAFLAGLMAWYFIYEKKIRPEHEKAEEKSKQLVNIERDQIQQLKIERLKNPPAEGQPSPAKPEYETIQLKKTGQDWTITAPVQDAVDIGTVTGMLSTLIATHQDRVIEEKPQDLEPFGLKAPFLKITVAKESASPAEVVLVGKNTPVGSSSYARVGDTGPVVRVPQSLRSTFDKDAKAVRNKEIVKIPRPDIAEVEIQNAKDTVIVKKDDKDQWTLVRDNAPADSGEWMKSFNAIMDLKAKDYATEKAANLETYGLKSPAIRVTLRKGKDQGTLGISIGRTKDKAFAKRSDKDTVYEIDKEVIKPLDRVSADYRDLRLSQFNRFDIGRIKLDRAKEPLELRKNGTMWAIPNEETQIDGTKVDTFLTALQDTKVSSFLKAGDTVKAPALTVHVYEIKNNAEKEVVTLKFAAPSNKQVKGEREGLNVPFMLKEQDWKKINIGKSDVLKPPTKTSEPSKAAAKTSEKKS